MISSRWPRPIGTMPSMALRPVCSGSRTGCRSTTPGRQPLDRRELLRGDRALAVDGLAERVDHAAEHLFADRHRDDPPGALDRIAFLDLAVLAEQHAADAVLLEVRARCRRRRAGTRASRRPWRARSRAGGRCRRRARSRCRLRRRRLDGEAADLLADDLGNLVCFQLHAFCLQAAAPPRRLADRPAATRFQPAVAASSSSCVRMLPSYTVPPTCAMTPPMRAGSTAASSSHLLAGHARRAGPRASAASRPSSGMAEVTAARTTLWCASSRSR